MRPGRAALLLVAGAIGAASAALAQSTVYRCGPDGRSYSQQPCPQGRVVDIDDARTADQRADGAAAVRRDAALARQLEHDRRLAESRAPRAVALTAPRPAAAKAPVRAEAAKNRTRSKSRAPKPLQPTVPPSKPVPTGR